MLFDSYRSFASLRMTTKRKRVILNGVKNLYIPPEYDIIIDIIWFFSTVGAPLAAPDEMIVENESLIRRGDPAWSPAYRAAATIPVPCCLFPVP